MYVFKENGLFSIGVGVGGGSDGGVFDVMVVAVVVVVAAATAECRWSLLLDWILILGQGLHTLSYICVWIEWIQIITITYLVTEQKYGRFIHFK